MHGKCEKGLAATVTIFLNNENIWMKSSLFENILKTNNYHGVDVFTSHWIGLSNTFCNGFIAAMLDKVISSCFFFTYRREITPHYSSIRYANVSTWLPNATQQGVAPIHLLHTDIIMACKAGDAMNGTHTHTHTHIYIYIYIYIYSISQKICTRFCCALLCCGYAIVHNEFIWSIYPYSSGLLCWHWGNRYIAIMPVK